MSETDDPNGDGEGVWSPEIEHAFQEALEMFPPCGRRKTILQGEGAGKMFGRNELIARHIYMKTGKKRTRKQVSSHIQVLARRRLRAEAGSRGTDNESISPASSINNSSIGIGRTSRPDSAMSGIQYQIETTQNGHNGTTTTTTNHQHPANNFYDIWTDRPIVTQKIRLVEFSAFIEHRVRCPQPDLNGAASSHHIDPATLAASLASSNLGQTIQVGNQQLHVPQPHPAIAHPLASSNQHLSAQFNQYSHLNGHHHYPNNDMLLMTATQRSANLTNGHQARSFNQVQQLNSTSGFLRHPYIKIDYRSPLTRQQAQVTKLEEIAINQIQDKFPEIGDPDGLFQRGPPDAFFLVKFWADLDTNPEFNQLEDQNSYFGFSSHFETIDEYKSITCSTKACSYGLQVVEKVDKIYGAYNSSNGRFSFDIDRSPMCEFMTQFIKKLRQLPTTSLMNSVLENFTVLQVVHDEATQEILLCLAYVFEIAPMRQTNGSQYHVYKLSKGDTTSSNSSNGGLHIGDCKYQIHEHLT